MKGKIRKAAVRTTVITFTLFSFGTHLTVLADESGESYTWDDFSQGKQVANTKVGTVNIYTQQDLEDYLERTGCDLSGDAIWFYNAEDIVFPKGTYYVDGAYLDFYLPSATGNIDFNGSTLLIGDGAATMRGNGDQYHRMFSNLTIYGTTGCDESYAFGKSNINPYTGTSKTGAWDAYLYHVSNMNFSHLKLNNAQNVDGHLFDVIGSSHITFDDIKARGSALSTSLGQDLLYNLYQRRSHSIFSEAIQLDSAILGSLGTVNGAYDGFFDGSQSWGKIWEGETYDNCASSDVSITQSEFTSYHGPTGLSLIRKIDQTVRKYGAGLGSHTVGKTGYHGIVIDDVLMEGTVYVTATPNTDLAPIKFLNSDYYQTHIDKDSTVKKSDYIAGDIVRQTTDIQVTNVRYVNTNTSGFLNPSGEDTPNSVWRAYYDDDDNPDNNKVTSVTNCDTNGHEISSIDGYSEVEPVINRDNITYTLIESQFDPASGQLIRTYEAS
ncbi:hypothetical protein SAMN05216347_103176 [Streptococcus equinus]|uniref:MucBP domain-containing protein n=1 Tax=Streptococcus equinus TaxID=1335 RepID=A0A1H0NPC6_STREI|nr:hypothetical protein [Streptococcus equinus]SDO94491.1 hypothetical protein SAMN05216347_103176 [Streptococcus equinus]